MKRCIVCRGWVWPWQGRGWRVSRPDRTIYWHGSCWSLREPVRRPGLMPYLLVAISSAIVGALITVAIVSAAPRSAAQPVIPAAAIGRSPVDQGAASGNLAGRPSGAPLVDPSRDRPPAADRESGAPAPTLDWHQLSPEPPAIAGGIASFMDPSFGSSYLALPVGPGHRVRICGPAECVIRTSNDAGPDLAMQRDGRIADLSFADFATVCRCDPWVVGLVEITLEDLG